MLPRLLDETMLETDLSQVEIYDQVWLIRHESEGKHRVEGTRLIQLIIDKLEQIPDRCAEWFPIELLNEPHLELAGKGKVW